MSYARAALAVIAAFLLQTGVLPLTVGEGVTPDFLLATAAAVALLAGPGPAIGFGLVTGLLQDSFSGGLLGMNGFSKPLVVFLAARAREYPPLDTRAGIPLLLLFAAAADLVVLWVLGEVAGFTAVPALELGAAGFGIPITVIYGLLVVRFLRPRPAGYQAR
ncbi:MAG: rod shape-determining protein MreD [Acidobacteria bacterium]|nr:rod shape-determining protein MreD [Acidobacteriota bacterium]MXW36894.1 rod shape-determining protein MreD [Acidobacteriota bacterium]MXZ61462.1 rod shape-determining protein MreD [Acidobacteriota bacterium]MYA47168.1 rod shape-determining protein MreD [Acidobacteriota bacterium]MYB31663.1 rod shape-determining protein MreD [Acidobacteriota bacterium]